MKALAKALGWKAWIEKRGQPGHNMYMIEPAGILCTGLPRAIVLAKAELAKI